MWIVESAHTTILVAKPCSATWAYGTTDILCPFARQNLDERVQMEQCVRRALDQDVLSVVSKTHRIIALEVSLADIRVHIAVVVADDLDPRINEVAHASVGPTIA